jgi:cell division septation protein DedD
MASANIAANIEGNISRYVDMHNVLNQYKAFNSSIAAFNNASSNILQNYVSGIYAGAVVKVTLNDGNSALHPTNYADIAFLESIYSSSVNDSKSAIGNYTIGSTMYDGKGMNDSVFQTGNQAGQYQTYKLALFIYDSNVLNYSIPQSAQANLLRMQGTSGGFYTGYDSNFSDNGTNTNAETTSLAVLALLPTPTPFSTPTSTPTTSPTHTPTPSPVPTATSTPYPSPTPTPTNNTTTLTPELAAWIIFPLIIAVSICIIVLRKRPNLTPIKVQT